jgi:carboxypeptidase family protein
MRPAALIVLLSLCLAVVPPGASAQETINHASLSGRVTDPQGGSVAGAEVRVRHTETNIKASAVTYQDGRFRFPFLRIGP